MAPFCFIAPPAGGRRVPVVIQEGPLAFAEWADVDNVIGFYPHPVQRGSMGNRRDNHPTAVLKADESPIEQVIDARRAGTPAHDSRLPARGIRSGGSS